MKFLIFSFLLIILSWNSNAQSWVPIDKSPLDQVYYPVDYPSKKIRGLSEPLRMRIIYSRPYKHNRKVFGSDIVPFGKVWRMGANEATEIEFFCNALIGGKKVPKGRYTLYALVTEKDWTFIINKDTDAWGAFNYDATKDLVRTTVPIIDLSKPIEALTIDFEKTDKGVNLVAEWDDKAAALPISFNTPK